MISQISQFNQRAASSVVFSDLCNLNHTDYLANTSTYNRVKKIQTHLIKTPENVTIYSTQEFCPHPDGSFLYLAKISSVDDNEDDSINTSLRTKTVVIHISSDFEYQCYYNTDITEGLYTTKHICCIDTENVVIFVNNQIRLYRISSGSLQFIKSTDIECVCRNIFFYKNKIYCFNYGTSLILDTNLNIKRRVEFIEDSVHNILPCSLQKYIGILYNDDCDHYIICEDSRLKQLKYLRKEGFLPKCLCAATEDSVFVFGEQDDELKILQVNTDMTVLSEICLDEIEMEWIDMCNKYEMVFDKDNSRLIIFPADYNDISFYAIYLE